MERVFYFIERTSSIPEELCVSAGGLLLLTRGTMALFSPSSGGLTAWAYRKSLPCGLDSIVYEKETPETLTFSEFHHFPLFLACEGG